MYTHTIMDLTSDIILVPVTEYLLPFFAVILSVFTVSLIMDKKLCSR